MTAGGKREGAGRKSKWKTGEETVRIMIQVPASKVEEIKSKIARILKPFIAKPKK